MKSFGPGSYAISGGVAFALLVGCGGSQPPIGGPGPMPQNSAMARTVVHRMTASSYLVLHRFDRPRQAAHPLSALIDVDGMLYGTTPHGGFSRQNSCGKGFYGCGTVYQINPASGARKVLFTFSGGDGSGPYAGLVDVKGTLYGTTTEGGEYGCGTVYRISTTGAYTPLHNFGCRPSDGEDPAADLIDVNGTLYGTTVEGGDCTLEEDGCGIVYSISRSGSEKVLYNFGGSSSGSFYDGFYPSASLIDVNGTLYGTTSNGGYGADCAGGCGIVYSLSTTGKEKVLHSFTGASDGAYPEAGLIDMNGILYGTTSTGGHSSRCRKNGKNFGCGTVYSLSTTGKEKVLHSFTGGSDGENPIAALTDVNGTLYGTTFNGGAHDDGTVFSITTSGRETVLYSFAGGSDGASPQAALLDVAGALYGTTSNGGDLKCHALGCGTVFEITP